MRRDYSGYLFILPICAITLAFFLIPIVLSLFLSFHEYNVIQRPLYIGLGNYRRILNDTICGISVRNICVYAAGVVPLQTLFSLLLAAFLTALARNPWSGFLKGAIFVPVISSYFLVGVIWRIIFNSGLDPVNLASRLLGAAPVMWLGQAQLAMASTIVATIWKNVGYFMVLYIAGIMEIPSVYYEAARIDGARPVQILLRITIPLLRGKTFFVIILGTIWSFQVFDLVYALTGGGPGFSTMTLVMHIYTTAFKQFQMGYGMALSYVLLLLVAIVSLLQMRLIRDK